MNQHNSNTVNNSVNTAITNCLLINKKDTFTINKTGGVIDISKIGRKKMFFYVVCIVLCIINVSLKYYYLKKKAQ